MESSVTPKKGPGPLLGTIWWVLTVVIVAVVAYSIDSNVYRLLLLGYRSVIALTFGLSCHADCPMVRRIQMG